ncbi:MAG: fasciclin domain-containing protein [Flavobacterium sp.]
MKNISKFRKMMLVCLVSLVAFSCDDDDTGTVPSQNKITSIAAATPDLSILVEALDRVDVISVLDGNGPFTVFAPTNDAFGNFLTANNYANLDAVPDAVLEQVLLNHVVAGSFRSTDLTTGYVSTQATSAASGTSMSMFVNTANGVRLNGVSTVSTPNIMASNGVIHIVDAVIGLPTVVTFVLADPNYGILLDAVTRDEAAGFPATLSSAGPFTVFAPTDAAFGAFLTETGFPDLASIPESALTTVLLYHVAGANVRSNQITNGQVVNTIAEQSFTINTTSGVIITDVSNRVTQVIAPLDVQANNGVIHTINKVLLPNLD